MLVIQLLIKDRVATAIYATRDHILTVITIVVIIITITITTTTVNPIHARQQVRPAAITTFLIHYQQIHNKDIPVEAHALWEITTTTTFTNNHPSKH